MSSGKSSGTGAAVSEPIVSRVRFTAATGQALKDGLQGHCEFEVSLLRLEGVMVRRTRAGRLVLSFPTKRDVQGRQHNVVRPVDQAARDRIEREVFAALGLIKTEASP